MLSLILTLSTSKAQNCDLHIGQGATPISHSSGCLWSCLLANHLAIQERHHMGRQKHCLHSPSWIEEKLNMRIITLSWAFVYMHCPMNSSDTKVCTSKIYDCYMLSSLKVLLHSKIIFLSSSKGSYFYAYEENLQRRVHQAVIAKINFVPNSAPQGLTTLIKQSQCSVSSVTKL